MTRIQQARSLSQASLLALAVMAGSACSSDDATVVDLAQVPEPPGDTGASSAGNLYAMAVYASGPDSVTTYLATISSLDAGAVLNLDDAIEFPGSWSVTGTTGYPAVWMTSGDEPIIQRWNLQEDGTFTPGLTLSFANLGLSATDQAINGVFTPDRATFAANEIGALVHWNPSTMEIIDTLPLEIPLRGETPAFVRNVSQRPDGTLLANYYYIDGDGNLGDAAGLVVVGASGDELIGRDEWEGCNYNVAAGLTTDGTAYFSAGAQWVQRNLVLPPNAPYTAPACSLRVLRSGTAYDRNFEYVDLGELAGGRPINGTLTVAGDDLAFFVAWQDDLVGEPLTVDNFDARRLTTPAWKWYRWDLSSAAAVEVPNADAFASLPSLRLIDGRLLFDDQRLTADNGGLGITPFYELTAEGVQPAFIGYGSIYSMVQLR